MYLRFPKPLLLLPSPSPMDPFPFSSMRLAIFLTTILCFCCTISFSATTTTSCISSVALLSDAAWTGPSTIFFAPASASLSSCCCCFPDDILLLPSSSFSGDDVEIRRMITTGYIIVVVPGPFSIEHLVVVVHGLQAFAGFSCRCDVEMMEMTLTPTGHCITFTTDDWVNTAKVITQLMVHGLQAFRISTTSLYLLPPFHPDHRTGAMVPSASMRLMSRDVILEDLAMKLLILSTRAPTFDFYKRADQWPMGVCVASPGRCVLPILPTHFTLHGLWPSNKGGRKKQPKFCSPSSHLDPKQIDDLMPRLKYGWPSLFKPNDQFWEHEWYKHGTCSSLQEHDYFELALDIYEQHNLTSILKDEGIIPGPTASYPKADITKAIKSKIGFEPELVCIGDYLVEIRLCLDVTATVYQQCPPQGYQSCKTVNILFVA